MNKPLSDIQLDILVDVGRNPGTTRPEVARRIGFDTSTVFRQLQRPEMLERIEILETPGRRPAHLRVRIGEVCPMCGQVER